MDNYQGFLEKSERKVFLSAIIGIIGITVLGIIYSVSEIVATFLDKCASLSVLSISLIAVAIMAFVLCAMKKLALARICFLILIAIIMIYESTYSGKQGLEIRIIAAAIVLLAISLGKIIAKVVENFDRKVYIGIGIIIALIGFIGLLFTKQGVLFFLLLSCEEDHHIKRKCEEAFENKDVSRFELDLLWEAFMLTSLAIALYGSVLRFISLL